MKENVYDDKFYKDLDYWFQILEKHSKSTK